MLPKKNLGAIGAMSAFLGLAVTHIITAAVYFSCFKSEIYTDGAVAAFNIIGIIEMLLFFCLSTAFGFIFVYSEDNYSTGCLIFSAVISILALSARFKSVNSNTKMFNILTFIINLSTLALFAVYFLKLRKLEMMRLSIAAISAGIWVSFLWIACKTAAENFASPKICFAVYALISLVSALCYGIAFLSQRQSFE